MHPSSATVLPLVVSLTFHPLFVCKDVSHNILLFRRNNYDKVRRQKKTNKRITFDPLFINVTVVVTNKTEYVDSGNEWFFAIAKKTHCNFYVDTF